MNQNQLIETCWRNPMIISYCRTLTGSKGRLHDLDELLSELVIQLYKIDETKLQIAYNSNYLEYLCFTICKRIWAGNMTDTGIFKKRIDDGEIIEYALEEPEKPINNLIDEMLEEISKLHWYNQTLIKMYLEGYNLREISEKTGINLKSIHYAIKKTKQTIKIKLEKKYGTNLNNFN